ncbi:hypothetical protein ACVIHD_004036 [Bradyrhizobium embrapense]
MCAGVGIEPRANGRAAAGGAVQPHETGAGQHFGQPLREARLAAAERADDVVQQLDVVQLEALAAPRPRQIECDADPGSCPDCTDEVVRRGHLAAGEVSPQSSHPGDAVAGLADARFERGLVRGQHAIEDGGVAAQDPRHFIDAEAEPAQRDDLGAARHLGRTIGAPSRRRAGGRDQAALLVEAQCFRRDPELPCSFGRAEETGSRSIHRITSRCLTAPLWRRPQGQGQAARVVIPTLRIEQ